LCALEPTWPNSELDRAQAGFGERAVERIRFGDLLKLTERGKLALPLPHHAVADGGEFSPRRGEDVDAHEPVARDRVLDRVVLAAGGDAGDEVGLEAPRPFKIRRKGGMGRKYCGHREKSRSDLTEMRGHVSPCMGSSLTIPAEKTIMNQGLSPLADSPSTARRVSLHGRRDNDVLH
jgi:hypothetical protein